MVGAESVQNAGLCAGPVFLQRCWNVPYGCYPQSQDLIGGGGWYSCWHFYAHRAAYLDPQGGFVALFTEMDCRAVACRVSWVVGVRQVNSKVRHVSRFQVCGHRGS